METSIGQMKTTLVELARLHRSSYEASVFWSGADVSGGMAGPTGTEGPSGTVGVDLVEQVSFYCTALP